MRVFLVSLLLAVCASPGFGRTSTINKGHTL